MGLEVSDLRMLTDESHFSEHETRNQKLETRTAAREEKSRRRDCSLAARFKPRRRSGFWFLVWF
jgi:hypothetical protein